MRQVMWILVIWWGVHSTPVFSQDALLKSKWSTLKSLQGQEFRDSVMIYYHVLGAINDFSIQKQIADSLFEITLQKDEIAHVHSLIFRATHSDSSQIDLFEEAFQLAKKNHSSDELQLVEYSLSLHYIAKKHYDSAMIHILNYQEINSESPAGEGNRNIVNLLGDIYYHAGLFNQAWEVYHDLYQQYMDEDNWNFYRPYVMINNLGQIALKTGKPEEARRWFQQSHQLAGQHLKTPYRDNTLAYIKIKLAETALAMDSLPLAERWLNEALAIPKQNIHEDVWQELMFGRANLLFRQGNIIAARNMALKLVPGDTAQFSDYRFTPNVYALLSVIYANLNDYPLALWYREKQDLLEDSRHESEHLARSMIILGKKQHEEITTNLQSYKDRYHWVLVGVFMLVAILLLFLWFYRNLYQSKVALVNRQIEKNQENIISKKEKNQKIEWDDEWDKQYQLIVRLQELMITNKPHLNPNINIQMLSELMDTNRTYLSKAINTVLETNFSKFINEYRISEAIRLISEGFASNHTVEALAQHAGFANRAVFNSVFKKQTGVTPSFFIGNYKRRSIDLSEL